MTSNPFYLILTFADVVDIGSKINDMHGQQKGSLVFSKKKHKNSVIFQQSNRGKYVHTPFLFWKERKFHLLRSVIRLIETCFDWIIGI